MKNWLRWSAYGMCLLVGGQAAAALRNYGQLSGTYVRSNLDDDYTGTRHFEVFVRAPAPKGSAPACDEWRIDIDLQNVEYRIVPISDMSSYWGGVFTQPSGYRSLPFGTMAAAGQGALDVMRHPGVLEAIEGHPWRQSPSLLQGSGVAATAPQLNDLFRNARRIYAFGESFSNVGDSCGVRYGVHNIHQNQGSTRSSAGVWQDGAIVVEYDAYEWIAVGNDRFGWPVWIQVPVPYRMALLTKFADQTDFATSAGRSQNSFGGWGRLLSSTEETVFGPFLGDQINFKATPLQLNRYDQTFRMNLVDAMGRVLASSDRPGMDVEFLRTYRTGMVWIEIDTAWGSSYSFEHNYANE